MPQKHMLHCHGPNTPAMVEAIGTDWLPVKEPFARPMLVLSGMEPGVRNMYLVDWAWLNPIQQDRFAALIAWEGNVPVEQVQEWIASMGGLPITAENVTLHPFQTFVFNN